MVVYSGKSGGGIVIVMVGLHWSEWHWEGRMTREEVPGRGSEGLLHRAEPHRLSLRKG